MNRCRVQYARSQKGLPDFPCKSVGIIEYREFAKTIDPRIKTTCIACPPDFHPKEFYCSWKFEIWTLSKSNKYKGEEKLTTLPFYIIL